MLKIGLSSCFMYPDTTRSVFGKKSLCYMEKDMGNFLCTNRSVPVLIPDVEDKVLPAFFDEISGLVFQGGTDLSPESYGHSLEEEEFSKWRGDRYRDVYEMKLMAMALERNMPIFGICRGLQLMNVYFGGTLIPDLTSEVKHRDAVEYDQINHEVVLEKEGLLHQLYKTSIPGKVNSVHHQCIDKLGNNLIVEALSQEDGIIEAISLEKEKHDCCFAVQWHPEFFYNSKASLIDPLPLLTHFLNHCEAYASHH